MANSGVQVPAGMSALKVFGTACGNRTPDCQKMTQAWKADSACAARADAAGKTTFPGVPAGTYYLMVSVRVNNQPLMWDLKVDLKPSANSITLGPQNSAPVK